MTEQERAAFIAQLKGLDIQGLRLLHGQQVTAEDGERADYVIAEIESRGEGL